MLASNQPYQRVDDGIGAGVITGGVIGGAMAATAGVQKNLAVAGLRKQRNGLKDKHFDMSAQGASPYDLNKVSHKITNNAKAVGYIKDAYKTTHGSGMRKAGAIASSVIAGGILGGIGDAIND